MIIGVILSLTGIGLLIVLMFNMAIFALPLFAGVTAGRLAFGAGAGWLGAILVGLTHIGGAHGAWQVLFASIGALFVAAAALTRLATPILPVAAEMSPS